MAQTLARAFSATLARHHTRSAVLIPRRLLTTALSRPSPPLPSRRSLASLIHAVRPPLPLSRFATFRGLSDGTSAYSPLDSASNSTSTSTSTSTDRPPNDTTPLFPGCDYHHWLVVMDKPGGVNASKDQMINCYVQTLAEVLGSEEEAKQKIYNVSCERYFGFGCEIDEETSNKLEVIPGVMFVLPDSYVDPENKDYGAELFVNGEIVQRSPQRQRRVDPHPSRTQDRPKHNDKTRYVRRQEASR